MLPIEPSPGSCRHNFILKPQQSLLPIFEAWPNSSAYCKVSSFCVDCRFHLDLFVDYRGTLLDDPCPNKSFPLHHLQHVGSLPDPGFISPNRSNRDQRVNQHRFICSASGCSVSVRVVVRPPRLGPEYVALLTDPVLIKERVQRELDRAPELLKGYQVPEPLKVLKTLRQCLRDAIQAPGEKRFPLSNRVYRTTLGEPCRELLEYLHFRLDENVGGRSISD